MAAGKYQEKKAQMLLQYSCVYFAACAFYVTKDHAGCGTNICISSKEIPYRARGDHSHWIIAVPNFYDFDLRNGGNYLGCNHRTCRKAKNLQYIYLDLTGVYLLKDSVLWWIKTA